MQIAERFDSWFVKGAFTGRLGRRRDTGAMDILSRRTSEEILRRNEIGRLGCYSPQAGQTYVVPISYRYAGGSVYFACLPGQKLEYVKEHPTGVCLEVEEVDDHQEWLTVIATGTVSEASGWEQVEQGLASVRRVARGPLRTQFSAALPAGSMDELVLFVLRPRSVSGRKDRWVLAGQPAPTSVPIPHPLAGHLTG